MSQPVRRQPHLSHLTGIRGIAAFAVMLGHFIDYSFSYNGIRPYHAFAAVWNYFGMTLFFVLSGFVITYSYYDSLAQHPTLRNIGRFFWARFARLYPLYIFALLLHVPIERVNWSLVTAKEALAYLALAQAWFNYQHVVMAEAWSISAEWFFYLLFALGVSIAGRLGRKRTAAPVKRLLGLAGFFILLYLLYLYAVFENRAALSALLAPYFSHRNVREVWDWLNYLAPYVRLGEFIVGAFAARLYMRGKDAPVQENAHPGWRVGACLAAILALGAYCALGRDYYNYLNFICANFAIAPFVAYLLYHASRYPGRLARALSWRPLVRYGEISYSLYLMQFLIFAPFFSAWLPRPKWYDFDLADFFSGLLALGMCFAFVTLVAALTYRYIETPSRNYLRRIGGLHSGSALRH